jgi:hypothetical protein
LTIAPKRENHPQEQNNRNDHQHQPNPPNDQIRFSPQNLPRRSSHFFHKSLILPYLSTNKNIN